MTGFRPVNSAYRARKRYAPGNESRRDGENSLCGECAAVFAAGVTALADGDLPSTSLYVQDGLIGHLDVIENGGAVELVELPPQETMMIFRLFPPIACSGDR